LRINVEDLKNQSQKEFHFKYSLNNLELDDAVLVEPVEVEVSLEFVEDEALLKGNYSTKVELSCVRCLEKFVLCVSGEFEIVYFTPEAYRDYYDSKGEEYQADSTVVEEIVEGQIDVAELVREQIILDLPPFPVCKETCEGLEEMGDYSNNGIDSRWQKLLDIEKKK
jgi:uncharacterized protein